MGTSKQPVSLRPMHAEEFAGFRATFIDDWASDIARAEDMDPAEARIEATRRTDTDLPQAENTPGHHLYIILGGTQPVGTLWWSISDGRAFVDDITVAEEHRGNRYGRRAMELMERELAARSVGLVQLNVYAHNPRARALYEQLGYRVTGLKLSKRLTG